MKIIAKYFDLSATQKEQFEALDELYRDWNSRINVISRKDIDNLYCHHVLHSLGICNMIRFKDDTDVLDFGTGGGFPGIPLAIMFPNVNFTLCDSIGKKIKVADAVAGSLQLSNVRTVHCRCEDIKEKFDFVVSRAVMELDKLVSLSKNLVHHKHKNSMPNGLICLKGGDIQHELRKFKNIADVQELYPDFQEEFFKTKKVVYITL